MYKTLSLLALFLTLISCGDKNETVLNLNDELGINDILKQEEYSKLYNDEDYKEYINDYWKNQLDIRDVVNHGTEMLGMYNINEKNNDLTSNASYTATAIADIGSVSIDAFQGMSL